jgi:hypothetical protein
MELLVQWNISRSQNVLTLLSLAPKALLLGLPLVLERSNASYEHIVRRFPQDDESWAASESSDYLTSSCHRIFTANIHSLSQMTLSKPLSINL